MEENREREWREEDVKITTPFLKKLDNFWYHYKWHTIFAVFILIFVTVCTLQTCNKESYDTYIMYATGKELNRNEKDGSVPEYNEALTSLNKVTGDCNGDGKASVSLITLFVPSEKEIADALDNNGDKEINHTLIMSDKETLRDRMLYSEYYLVFISPSVYEEYKTVDNLEIFAPIASYAPAGAELEYYSDRAVKLSSCDLYSLPGICKMPDDTLICLRLSSVVADKFGGSKNAENFKNAESALRAVLSYKKKS